MKASYKEAGKTRKWLFSVLVAIALVFSFVAPAFMTTQGSAYAEKQREYEIVIYGADGKTEVGRSSVSSVAGMFNVNARMEPGSNTINFVDAYGQPLENQDNGGFLGMTRFLSYVSPVTVSNTAAITGSDGNPAFTMKVFYEGKEIVTAASRSSSDENGKRVYAANTMIDPKISGNIETSTTNPDGVVVKQDNTTSDSPDPDGKTPKEECITSGAAGSLGWIVCPVMLFLSNSANELYDAVEQYLEVDTDIFDLSGSGGTFEAWQTFQRFANIAFVILFMVVVISQVTGVGINNYGIKKILPKLIVTAILVNISYWVCLIVVDISNIVGASIQNLLTGMGPALNVSGTSVAVVGVTLLTALLAGGIAIVLNPAVVLGLLISAIGLVVSLLTLLVLLAARKAIVVVLVVASPIAIVCYMLPNTKKVFDKWVKVAEGMLLLYPTASLLVGAGNFVSRLMMSTDAGQTFFGAFVAILVSIVPIFFIPKLLTSAFAVAGNIGAKISGIGKTIGGNAQRSVRGSNAYKQTATRMNAGVNRSGNLTGLGKARAKIAESRAGRFMGLDRMQAGNLAAAKKDLSASDTAGAMLAGALARDELGNAEAIDDSQSTFKLGGGFAKGQEGAYYGKMFLAAAEKGNETEMNAAIEAMRSSNMKPKDIARLVRYAENNGKLKFNGNDNARAAWLRDLSKKYGNDFLSTDMELGTWAKTGGSYSDSGMTSLGDYGDYANMINMRNASGNPVGAMINYDDIKPEDIGRLSGDSLAGMAHSGLLDASMARSVLASNQNLSADKKIMLSAIAAGVDAKAMTAQQFKDQAKTAMTQTSGNVVIGGKTFDLATRDSWTASQPRAVNIVDVDGNGLVVPHGGGGTGSAGGASGTGSAGGAGGTGGTP